MRVISKKDGIWLCSTLLLTLLLAASPADAVEEVDVEKIIRERVDNGLSVGIVVGVIDPNNTKFYSYGKMVRGSDKPADKNTIYEIGSVTKVFTAVLLLEFRVNRHMLWVMRFKNLVAIRFSRH